MLVVVAALSIGSKGILHLGSGCRESKDRDLFALAPVAEVRPELAVLIAVGVLADARLPQQLEGHPLFFTSMTISGDKAVNSA